VTQAKQMGGDVRWMGSFILQSWQPWVLGWSMLFQSLQLAGKWVDKVSKIVVGCLL